MRKPVGIVYLHRNKITGKIYVGQAKQPPKRRWRKNAKSYHAYKTCTVFYNALLKYGWDNFDTEELCSCFTQECLDQLEEYYIKFYDSLAPKGYNSLALSDNKVVMTEAVRTKISMSRLGKKTGKPSWNRKYHTVVNGLLGKECSCCDKWKPLTDYCKDRSAKWDGLSYYCKACRLQALKKYKKEVKLSPEQLKASYEARKTKIAESLKNKYKLDESLRKKVGLARAKPILGVHIETEQVIEFPSAQAAKLAGFDPTRLSISIKNQTPYKGYLWKFKQNDTLDSLRQYIQSIDPKAGFKVFSSYAVDIYVPSAKLAIFYNDLKSFTQDVKGKLYNLQRMQYFQSLGISSIIIWQHYLEHSKEQVINFLRPKLGAVKRIYARNCEVHCVPKAVAIEFCNKNHIQKAPKNLKQAYGLFYNKELVGLATVSSHHRGLDELVLSRLCFSAEYLVVGGLSKLSKTIEKHNKCPIFTWVDLSLSCGNSYIKSGWEVLKQLPPDYFYVDSNGNYVSKQSRKKSNSKTPSHMTELEHAKKDGLSRIWDCGKLKLVFRQ